jgi:hypothetical protein
MSMKNVFKLINAPRSSLIDSTTLQMWKQQKDKELGYTLWLVALQG